MKRAIVTVVVIAGVVILSWVLLKPFCTSLIVQTAISGFDHALTESAARPIPGGYAFLRDEKCCNRENRQESRATSSMLQSCTLQI